MDATLQARLERLRHYSTRYEAVLTHADSGERRLLCYTARKSSAGLLSAVFSRGEALVAFSGAERVENIKGAGLRLGPWRVAFSGRTQREAIITGELTYFADSAIVRHLSTSDDSTR